MQIQPIRYQQNNSSFKSTFPVVHWVAESNGSYAPVANLKVVKSLQGKIIRMLNKPLDKNTKPIIPLEQRLRAYLGVCDIDYRTTPKVRSFYNRTEGGPEKYYPVSYIISGDDVDIFEDCLAKNIGRSKSNDNNTKFLETKEAVRQYNTEGLRFVKNPKKQIQDASGLAYTLHTKFEIVRNRLGKIKDYRFIEARFLPNDGSRRSLGKM